MRICHITCVHPRHDIRIFEKECVSLADAGYETYLVVNDDKPDECLKNVHIVSTGHCSNSRVERLLKSSKQVLRKALEIDAEIYHLHDPELLSVSKALLKKGKKVIFDAHEDTEEQIRDKVWIPKAVRGIVANLYAIYAYKKISFLSGVVSVTPSIVDKLKKYNSNIVMITNYPILDNDKLEKVSEKNPICDKKYVFFAGGVFTQWSHVNIAEAIRDIDDVEYIFAGRLESDDYLNRIPSTAKYLGILPHDEVMRYYENSLAGMALLQCTQVGKEGTLGNTKLFEIMQAGKPVICSDLLLWKRIIEKYHCGICVSPNNIKEIEKAICFLRDNPKQAKEMGKNGKRAVLEEFNWESQKKKLIELYETLTSEEQERK